MKNTYEIRGDVAVIFARRHGQMLEFLIDVEDLSLIDSYPNRWSVIEPWPGCRYLVYSISRQENYQRVQSECIYAHRIICPGADGKIVDHINHNTLDNRKANLRATSKSVNTFNRRGAQKNSGSGVRGVSWCGPMNAWRARATFRGKEHLFGYFDNVEDAGRAAEEGRKEIRRRYGISA